MLKTPQQHDRAAQRFEDLAMGLDAGLGLHTSLGLVEPTMGQSTVESICLAGQALEELDRRVLEAAEQAGELPQALRDRAQSHRFHAEALRLLGKKLAYPALVLCLSAATLVLLEFLGFYSGAGVILAVSLAVVVLLSLSAWRYARGLSSQPSREGRGIPGLHGLLWDHGILPYLDALHALYRSGVPIREAHEVATKVSPVAWVRLRLARAAQDLAAGSGLSEALGRQAALDADSQSLLTKGEISGNLEESLRRVAELRRQTLRRRILQWAGWLGTALYILAILAVAFVALSFYTALYAPLSSSF